MTYSYFILEDTAVISLKGDFLGLPLENALFNTIVLHSRFGVKRVVLDLRALGHINSKGLSILVKSLTFLDRIEGKLVLMSPPKQTSKILKITKLDRVFDIKDSRKVALKVQF